MKISFLRGRTGRFLLFTAGVLLLTAMMFALASVLFTWDPSGEHIRSWLYDGRFWLFAWRMSLYAGIGAVWFLKVRPAMVKRWPDTAERTDRLELLVMLFMALTELVTWAVIVPGGVS